MRLGADPEIFLQNAKGKHISAIGYINADKWNPMQIPDMEKGFSLQEDNVALEFGIPPASSADEFYNHINSVMKRSLEYLPNLFFSKLSCTVFKADQMKHPAAHIFGCEPDWSAWTQEENKKPEPPHKFMRSAGGHVHVETKADCVETVKKMDLFLSVPSVLMDKGEKRKQLYGKAGAFRKKPYGLEYRTLSNFWIAPGGTEEERKKYCTWVWEQTQRALNVNMDMDKLHDYIDIAVNKNDKNMAMALVNEYNLVVV